jgi:hypothetical protein
MQTQGVAETSGEGCFYVAWGLEKVFAAKDKISWKKGVSGTLNSGLKKAHNFRRDLGKVRIFFCGRAQ